MRFTRTAAVVLATLIGGALGMGATASAASAMTMPLSFDFGVVLPGETRTGEDIVSVPVRSTIADATWTELQGDAGWSASLCDETAGCTAIDALAGTTLDAGDYRLSVTITMAADAPQGSAAAARGVLQLTAAPETLAVTGRSTPMVAIAAGAVIAAAGTLLVLFAHRRREAS